MEAAGAQGRALEGVSSVASFFLSRINVLIDPLLENKSAEESPASAVAGSLRGEVAIASAKIACQTWKEMMAGERFQSLGARGAHLQRVLWASTGTKNPAYNDVKYLEALIGPETVNTAPLETLSAYRDHGNPDLRLELGVEDTGRCLRRLSEVGIDLDAVTQQLEDEAVTKFVKPFDSLMKTLQQKRIAAQG
jgi:transaldolase